MSAVGNYEVTTGTVNVSATVDTLVAAPSGKVALSFYLPANTVLAVYPATDGSGFYIKHNGTAYPGTAWSLISAEMGICPA